MMISSNSLSSSLFIGQLFELDICVALIQAELLSSMIGGKMGFEPTTHGSDSDNRITAALLLIELGQKFSSLFFVSWASRRSLPRMWWWRELDSNQRYDLMEVINELMRPQTGSQQCWRILNLKVSRGSGNVSSGKNDLVKGNNIDTHVILYQLSYNVDPGKDLERGGHRTHASHIRYKWAKVWPAGLSFRDNADLYGPKKVGHQ